MTELSIILDYTPRSHILVGEALKEVYAEFRIKVLREVEWATWHTHLKVPGGKGWCIRKTNLQDLENRMREASIPYTTTIFVCPKKTSSPDVKEVKKKRPPSAYNLFTKKMWADREGLAKALGEDAKKSVVVTKYIAKKWRERPSSPTSQTKVDDLPQDRDSYETKWDKFVKGRPGYHYVQSFYDRKWYFTLFEAGFREPWAIKGLYYDGMDNEHIFKTAWEAYQTKDDAGTTL